MDTDEQPKRLSETVAAEIQRLATERETEAAYADLPEPTNTPANPGSSFGQRVSQRIQQECL
jgi:hypothetical protein